MDNSEREFYQLELKEGLYYEGEIINGLPDGRGIMISVDGERNEVIEGHWTKGKLNGTMRRIGSEGEDYIGTFKDGKKHGYFVKVIEVNEERLVISKG